MGDITRDLFVSLAAFSAIFGIAYVYLVTRHRERMSMLEKGVDPTLFGTQKNFTSFTLKFGMLSVGIAIGILLGNILQRNDWLDRRVSYVSMLFLFGGISLILNYWIDRRNAK